MKSNLNPSQLSDKEFVQKIKDCTLAAGTFNHEAHLRLAWIQIDEFGVKQAKENIQNQLQNFVAYAGAQDKYHHTLTVAAIEVVNHFMRKSESNCFKDFIIEFPQLKSNFKDLINSHYSFDIFQSAKAKNEYLKPDISPFR